MNRAGLGVAGVLGTGAAAVAYAGLVERNAYTLRRFEIPVLAPGTDPIRVLHISDLHITAAQARKQRWIAGLARLEPDLVINTGDTISDENAIDAIVGALRPLARFPAVFVPGNNDYYLPVRSNPVRYFGPDRVGPHGSDMPWPELAAAMVGQGWTDLTHVRTTFALGGGVALAGTDDPHLGRARYELIAGPPDASAAVRIGVIHSPEPDLLARFAADGYDLVLAGHTHGGQVRVPFGPAIVTNCGIDIWRARGAHLWDDGRMWFHVCAGLGTNPFMPLRFACRPEAVLLTLVGRPAS